MLEENIAKRQLYIFQRANIERGKIARETALVDELQFCGRTDRSIKNRDGTLPRSYVDFCTNYQLPFLVERISTVLLLLLLHFDCLPNYKSRINTMRKRYVVPRILFTELRKDADHLVAAGIKLRITESIASAVVFLLSSPAFNSNSRTLEQ